MPERRRRQRPALPRRHPVHGEDLPHHGDGRANDRVGGTVRIAPRPLGRRNAAKALRPRRASGTLRESACRDSAADACGPRASDRERRARRPLSTDHSALRRQHVGRHGRRSAAALEPPGPRVADAGLVRVDGRGARLEPRHDGLRAPTRNRATQGLGGAAASNRSQGQRLRDVDLRHRAPRSPGEDAHRAVRRPGVRSRSRSPKPGCSSRRPMRSIS